VAWKYKFQRSNSASEGVWSEAGAPAAEGAGSCALALADNINNNQIANIVFDKVIVPHRYVSSLDRIYPPGYACKVLSATYFCQELFMAHTLQEKKKLLNRVHRIMGQVAAIEIEGHIRYHILGEDGSATDEQARAADDLVRALRAYLK